MGDDECGDGIVDGTVAVVGDSAAGEIPSFINTWKRHIFKRTSKTSERLNKLSPGNTPIQSLSDRNTTDDIFHGSNSMWIISEYTPRPRIDIC